MKNWMRNFNSVQDRGQKHSEHGMSAKAKSDKPSVSGMNSPRGPFRGCAGLSSLLTAPRNSHPLRFSAFFKSVIAAAGTHKPESARKTSPERWGHSQFKSEQPFFERYRGLEIKKNGSTFAF